MTSPPPLALATTYPGARALAMTAWSTLTVAVNAPLQKSYPNLSFVFHR